MALTRWSRQAEPFGTVLRRRSTCILSGGWSVIQHKAVLDEERELVLWPGGFSFEALMQRRREMGEILFGCQYENDPSGLKGQLLKPEWMHWYERGEEPARDAMLIFMAVDPAISQAPRADYFALVVVGMDDDRNIWILDTYRDRLDFPAQMDVIKSKAVQWDACEVAIEEVAYQLSLVQALMRESSLPVVRSKSTGDKTARIMAMGPHFENGRIRVRRDMRELETEYLAFPRGAHDDLLDALEMAVAAALDTRQPWIIQL